MTSAVVSVYTVGHTSFLTNSVKMIRHQLLQNKVVGLGEAHWFSDVFEHWQAVVLHEYVLDVCQDIVLEAGNQHYQDKVTAFINGDNSIDDHQILNMLMSSIVFPVWFAPYYLNFFKQVRLINLKRRRENKPLVRLHVLEPAFVWRDIHTQVDYLKVNGSRDAAFYRQVELDFLKPSKPAIVLMGARHFLRHTGDYKSLNFAQYCQRDYPSHLYVVWPHIFSNSVLDKKREQQGNQLISTKDKSITNLPFNEVCPMPQLTKNITLEEQVDGVLLMQDLRRDMSSNIDAVASIDKYELLHRAQYMNKKQQQLIQYLIT